MEPTNSYSNVNTATENISGDSNDTVMQPRPLCENSASVVNNSEPMELSNPPRFEVALDFLDKLKERFLGQPEVYSSFLDLMVEFKKGRIDVAGVISRVQELFGDSPDLILEFDYFLPKGFKIQAEERAPNAPKVTHRSDTDYVKAKNYVMKVKNRFSEQPHIYKQFLDILHSHGSGTSVLQVTVQITALFNGHPDLIEEFDQFLPAQRYECN